MKAFIKFLPVMLLVVACSSGNDAINKRIALKKQQIAKLEQQITELENALKNITQLPVWDTGSNITVITKKG